jgi:hypothetical protein
MLCIRPIRWTLIWVLLLSGCATSSRVDLLIRETPQGSVYLDRLPDRRFQASHPIKFDEALIARTLQGMMIREETGLLRTLTASQKPTGSVFSATEIAFLAPAIAEGLKRAASDQQVGFRLIQASDGNYRERAGAAVGSSEPPLRFSSPETTTGQVFAYGRSLYVQLTEYRQRRDNPDTVNMPNRRLPEPTGLLNRQISFVPAEALRPDQYAPSFAEDPTKVLIIDYDLLAKLPTVLLPPATTTTAQPAEKAQSLPLGPADQQANGDTNLRAIREELKKKDSEVEELRKELQDIKRQLGEQKKTQSGGSSKPPRSVRPAERAP